MAQEQEKKLRHSRLRDEIYAYLLASVEHPSAEMIYTALSESNPSLSLGTVYRNLCQLEELGMIVRVATVSGRERYDARCYDHVHFICDTCHGVTDLPGVDIEAVKRACGAGEGLRAERISIVLGSICAECSNK